MCHTILIVSLMLLMADVHCDEWPTLPSEMSESSAQAARPRRLTATSPLPFVRQIGAPSLRAKRVITPIPEAHVPQVNIASV
ncbi:hypothetical protein TELCIR_14967 [Teladorsagia circumcincta]|uniref:Secreted protein n=1 Tax=Teladorsagia circumcincta TaxID=45464 RepID=A0A2G9U1Q2_TELCI|nr:hypothetical protein TELCIR_14967 [Teladorsagia circumcincta]